MEVIYLGSASGAEGYDVNTVNPELRDLIGKHTIFQGLGDQEIDQILPLFKLVSMRSGEILIEEGLAVSKDLFLILSGSLEVIKSAEDTDYEIFSEDIGKEFTIAHLNHGDAIGELSFIKGAPRSASIKSSTKSILLSLDPNELQKLETEYPRTSSIMMKNMVGYVGDRLKKTSANEVKALKTELQKSILNSKANIFFSYIIGVLCIYNLTIHIITNLSTVDAKMTSIVSATIIVVFSGVLVLMIRHSQLPIKIFGMTTKNWKFALKDSLIWSIGIITFFAILKWILINNVPKYQDLTIFDFHPGQQKYLAFNFILYGLHSPIQEFIARGVLQGSLQHFFTGKNVTVRAILISNALFAATHVHLMSGWLALIVFIPGLFWGWLYSRHNNLLGVSISHLLIGWAGLFFLNFESLL